MSTETQNFSSKKVEEVPKKKRWYSKYLKSYRESPLALKLFYHTRLPHMFFYRMGVDNSPEKIFDKYQPYLNYPESERKAIIKDMTREFWLHGVHFDEFLYYDFYKKDRKYRDSFVTGTYKVIHVGQVNQTEGMLLFNNKYAFAQKYAKYFKRDFLELNSADDYSAFCAFLKKHPSFIKKPLTLSKGKDIEIIETNEKTDPKALLEYLTQNGNVIIEELVIQHPEMRKLNESSVNTIRMITVLTGNSPENYEVHVFHPCVRIGRAGSVIDNADTGGILVKIGDIETGKLYPIGKDRHAVAYTHHPDNGLCFADFTIPQWADLIRLTKEIALVTPENRFVGWDYALSENNGWVLIEGNAALNFSGPQICDLVGKRPELEALLKKMK